MVITVHYLVGMNCQTRELDQHVEMESTRHYSTFAAELDVCAASMWQVWAALREEFKQKKQRSDENLGHLVTLHAYHLPLIRGLVDILAEWFIQVTPMPDNVHRSNILAHAIPHVSTL